jgi:hypothetical protein
MPQVEITGFGKVNFPDGFTEAQIQEAIERDIIPNVRGTEFQRKNAALDATGRVGFRSEQQPGQEFVPGEYLEGQAPRKPKLYQAPQPAPEGNFGAAFKDSFAADEGTRLRLIADELFPGDPKGVERVGIRNGRPVFVNDEGNLQYVSGTKSNILGGVAGSLPEILGGVAGAFIPGNPVVGSAVGSMAGRAVKRGISNALFDEPVTPGSLAKEVAIEGATSVVGSGAGKLIGKAADRGRVVDFTPAELAQAEATRAAVKSRTGIELDLAQASGDRRLIALRDYAARYPGQTASLIQAQDEIASGQFDAATKRVLDAVSQPIPSGTAGLNAINAAEQTIKAARAGVQQEVQPLYDAAYASVPQITDPSILNFLKLPYFEQAFKSGQRIAQLERSALQPGQAPDLRSFDYLKQGLDDVIQKLEAKGARKEARALRERKNELVSQLDVSSGDLYRAARQGYAQRIAARVEPLENGLVGALAKLDPADAATAGRIFNDPSVTPESIALLKAKVSQTNPDAYRGLVRQYLANAYNKAQKLTQGGDVVNAPGKFLNQLAPTPDARNRLLAILPRDSFTALDDVLVAAQALAKTPLGASRVAGSNTARDSNISEILKGRGVAIARALISPRQALKDAAEFKAQEQGVLALTEALIDPAKRDQLRRIVRMSDRSKQAILLATFLGGQATAGAGADLTDSAGLGQ